MSHQSHRNLSDISPITYVYGSRPCRDLCIMYRCRRLPIHTVRVFPASSSLSLHLHVATSSMVFRFPYTPISLPLEFAPACPWFSCINQEGSLGPRSRQLTFVFLPLIYLFGCVHFQLNQKSKWNMNRRPHEDQDQGQLCILFVPRVLWLKRPQLIRLWSVRQVDRDLDCRASTP
jgi:hypothetical protein